MNEDSIHPTEAADRGASSPRDASEAARDAVSQEGSARVEQASRPREDAAAAPDETAAATPRLDDGRYRHPSPMHLRLERIGGLIGLLVLSLIGGTMVSVLWFVGPFEGALRFIPLIAYLLLIGWSAFMGLYWPKVSHRHRRYRLDPESIEIQKGVLWRSSVSVPCSRVQHADVAQGPLERRLGLATLTLHTAGTEHASVVLDGIEHERAVALRDHLVGAADRIPS